MNICLVSDNNVMEHFAFPGNINFAAQDQSAFSFIIHEMLLCLFIVCETMFAIVESRTRSTASACKSSPRKIFHWNSSGERRLKFIGQRIEEDNCEAERTSLSTAKATTLACRAGVFYVFLTKTRRYFDRGRHLEKQPKRLRGRGGGRGEGRGGERRKRIFSSPHLPLPYFKPIYLSLKNTFWLVPTLW